MAKATHKESTIASTDIAAHIVLGVQADTAIVTAIVVTVAFASAIPAINPLLLAMNAAVLVSGYHTHLCHQKHTPAHLTPWGTVALSSATFTSTAARQLATSG
jgi:hypothetical protein